MEYFLEDISSHLLNYPDVHPIFINKMPDEFKSWVYLQMERVTYDVDNNIIIHKFINSRECVNTLISAKELHESFLVILTQSYLGSDTSSFDPCPDNLISVWSILDVIKPAEAFSWLERHKNCLFLHPDIEYRGAVLETLAPDFGSMGLKVMKLLIDDGSSNQWDNIETYKREEFVHFLHECSMRALHPGYCNDKLDLPNF